ncbi:TonB-dependent receptor plug domain-containing protein [Sphingomonas sp.]|uniref:TonB-dependent receptor plug domain-containing protein n=1 Tax=Sphingomonas sp. TaxID=28214 RepID=UPI002D1FC090|nr:outer membrane beta-barrel protein [Sphingomonas sp.]
MPLDFPAGFFADFHPNSALDMVKRIPGFTFDPGDATLRGMAEAAGNVVVDGKRITDKNFTLDQVLDRIPAAQVDHIALIRGGAPGIDMLGQPVVANIVRKAAAGATTAVTVSDGVYADGRTIPGVTIERSTSSGTGRSLSWSASLSRYVEVNKGDGSRLRTDAAGAPIQQARVDAAAGGLTGYAQGTFELPAWNGQLRLNGTLTWTDYHDHQRDRQFVPVAVVTRLNEDLGGLGGGQAGAELGAHFSRTFGPLESETTALLRFGRKRYASLLDSPGAALSFGERDRTSEALLRSQLRYKASADLSAALSIEAAYNHLDTSSMLAFNSAPISLPDAVAQVSEARGEIGAQATWQAAPAIQIEAGGHVELSQIRADADQRQRRSYVYPKPFVRLTLLPGRTQQIRLRFEREVGQLDFTNFIAAATLDKGSVSSGNSAIRPNNSWVAEAAYEWRKDATALSLTYRHSWLRDAIDRVPVRPTDGGAVFDAPGNIGNGREDDLIGDMTLPLSVVGLAHATLKLDGTWRRARVTDPTTGHARAISNQKPLQFTADFHQDLPRWKAAWGATLDAGWSTHTYLFDEVDLNKASALLTVFADYIPHANLSVHIEASDVLGRRYSRVISVYDGLRGSGGLAYRDARRLRLGPALSLKVRRAF